MTKTFLDESICHLMDTKRPNYERLVDRMAPKFTKGWSKLEKKKKKKVHCAVQILWYLWMKSHLFIHPEQQEEQMNSNQLLFLGCTSAYSRIPTAFLDLAWACSQVQICLSPHFLPIKLWPEAYSCLLAGWWGRCHPLLKYKKIRRLPRSAAECTH